MNDRNIGSHCASDNTVLARYYCGPVIDELLCRVTETNTVYYHHDDLGSTNTGLNPLTVVANFAPTLTTNGTLYLWGSNPVGGKEWPRMTVEWVGGSNAMRVVLTGTVTSRVYTVEGTTDLRGGWSEWASAAGSNGVTVFTFPATNSATFFRARARLP